MGDAVQCGRMGVPAEAIVSRVQQSRPGQKFRRRGFALGILGGALFIVWKALKYPGSIDRHDAWVCVGVVLLTGLVGGLIGLLLGKLFGSSDRDNRSGTP